jgi:glycosyltransferase involved in cell wall biosynthesis
MSSLSIVIPTYNRADILAHTLAALQDACREIDELVEVVVVDDGSTDHTPEIITRTSGTEMMIQSLRQANQGPAAARNRGWQAAQGTWILFIGDDILITPRTLTVHLSRQRQLSTAGVWAVQGPVTWAPELTISPFMRWWEKQRFKYPAASGVAPFWCFYTSNVSVPRQALAQAKGFDEAFRYAAYEDTELAFRLANAGLEVYFDADALAYHNHPTDPQEAWHQMELAGRSHALMESHTGLKGLPRLWRWVSLGPWMRPRVVRWLCRRVERGHSFSMWRWAAVIVLTYAYLVGQGRKRPAEL